MSESKASTGEKEQLSSKVISGIANSGKKMASGGSSVASGIKSSGGKAISGIASTGGKAIHTIASPIGSAVRQTVDKANSGLHGNSSHGSTSSAKEEVAETHDNNNIKEGSIPAPKEEDSSDPSVATPEPKGASVAAPASSIEATSSTPEAKNDSRYGLLGSVENVTNKLLVTPVKGAAGFVSEGGNKLLVTPAKSAAHKVAQGGKAITQRSKEALHITNKSASRDLDSEEEDESVPLADVPPDDTLKKMNIIINKRLKDVPIPDYYAVAWSEGQNTNKAPLYGPWLKESGKQDIKVGEWEFADEGKDFVGDWDGEKYTQKRVRRSV